MVIRAAILILGAVTGAAGDDRSYDWHWEYTNPGWRKSEMRLNFACLAFNAAETFTTPAERAFADHQYRRVISERYYDRESHVTLDYTVGPRGFAYALHDLPVLGYEREIVLAGFGGRLHLFVIDHADYSFHDYPIRR